MPAGKNAWVFLDLDGTLIGPDRQIPQSAIRAIRQLRSNGHLAFVNTGRCMAMIGPDVLKVGFDGIVAACGTHIQYQGQTLFETHLELRQLDTTVQMLIDHQVDFWLEGPNQIWIDLEHTSEFMTHFMAGFANWPRPLFADFRQKHKTVNKFCYRMSPACDSKWVIRNLNKRYTVIRHSQEHGECFPIGFSKGKAIQFLRANLELQPAVTFAIGDSLNDLDMLQAADIGIAMDGSPEAVIACADYCTAAPQDDGLAQALKKYGLID